MHQAILHPQTTAHSQRVRSMSFLIAQVASSTPLKLPSIQYSAIGPELIMICGGLIVLLISSLVAKHLSKAVSVTLGVIVGLASLVDSIYLGFHSTSAGANKAVLSGAIAIDKFAIFFYALFSIVAVMTILVGLDQMNLNRGRTPEFVTLILLSTSGAMLMAAAVDLIVLFLGLEILSIALYVLVAIESNQPLGKESAIKYFMLGGFASAIFLYGIALVYGATGSTNLGQIVTFLSNNLLRSNGVLFAGMALMLVGLGFKISAAPFHFWTPDVYQGAPSPVTGYMAATAKAAGFAGLLRVFYSGFLNYRSDWIPAVGALAVVTLLVGAVLAVVQTDVKRTLAYSSINQAGFILLGLYAATSKGLGASLYYLAIYSVIIVGAFATIGAIQRELGKEQIVMNDLRGLYRRSPFLAFAFAVLMFAQAGAPLTTGFLAKFNVVLSIVDSGHYPVALVAMISAAIAVFFYLRLAILVYRPAGDEISDATSDSELVGAMIGGGGSALAVDTTTKTSAKVYVSTWVIGFSLVATVVLGIVASPLIDLANRALPFF